MKKEARTMTTERIHTSAPDRWTNPRPHSDPSLRRAKHGRVLPMQKPTFVERLLGL